jgi:hypothetical protein
MNSLILRGPRKLLFPKVLHSVFKEKAILESGENIALIFKGELIN